jgi:hypothetical protein
VEEVLLLQGTGIWALPTKLEPRKNSTNLDEMLPVTVLSTILVCLDEGSHFYGGSNHEVDYILTIP